MRRKLLLMVAIIYPLLRLQELGDRLRQGALGAEPPEVGVPLEAAVLRQEPAAARPRVAALLQQRVPLAAPLHLVCHRVEVLVGAPPDARGTADRGVAAEDVLEAVRNLRMGKSDIWGGSAC